MTYYIFIERVQAIPFSHCVYFIGYIIYLLLDNDKLWYLSKESLKESIEATLLEEAVKIVEASGMKVLGKEKRLESEADQSTESSFMFHTS